MFRPRALDGLYAPARRMGECFVVSVAAWTHGEGVGVGGVMARKGRAGPTGVGHQAQ